MGGRANPLACHLLLHLRHREVTHCNHPACCGPFIAGECNSGRVHRECVQTGLWPALDLGVALAQPPGRYSPHWPSRGSSRTPLSAGPRHSCAQRPWKLRRQRRCMRAAHLKRCCCALRFHAAASRACGHRGPPSWACKAAAAPWPPPSALLWARPGAAPPLPGTNTPQWKPRTCMAEDMGPRHSPARSPVVQPDPKAESGPDSGRPPEAPPPIFFPHRSFQLSTWVAGTALARATRLCFFCHQPTPGDGDDRECTLLRLCLPVL